MSHSISSLHNWTISTCQPLRMCHLPKSVGVARPKVVHSIHRNKTCPPSPRTPNKSWLVVYLPLWRIWVRQLGWWNSQYDGKVIIHSCSKPPSRIDDIRIFTFQWIHSRAHWWHPGWRDWRTNDSASQSSKSSSVKLCRVILGSCLTDIRWRKFSRSVSVFSSSPAANNVLA